MEINKPTLNHPVPARRKHDFTRILAVSFVCLVLFAATGCSTLNKPLTDASHQTIESAGAVNAPAAIQNATEATPEQMVPPEASYFFMLGYEAELFGRWEEAYAHYQRAMLFDPESSYLSIQLARIMIKAERFEDAERLLETSLEKEPDNIDTLELLAQALNSLKKLDRSIEVYERLIKLAPETTGNYVHLAILQASSEDFAKARKTIEAMHGENEEIANANYYLGIVSLSIGNMDEAEVFLRDAIALDDTLDSAYLNLGVIQQKRGNPKKAEEMFKKASSLNPDDIRAKEKLAQIYLDLSEFDEAIAVLREIATMPHAGLDANRKIALIYLNQNKYNEAIEEIKVVLEAEPDDTDFRYYMALAYEALDQDQLAAEQYQKIIESGNLDNKHLINLGFIYSRLGEHDKAIATFKKLVEGSDPMGDFYIYLGRAYMAKEDLVSAEKTLKSGIKRFPDEPELYFTLALVYEKLEDTEAMIEQLRNTIALDPEHAEALNFLGYSFAERGINLDEALTLIQKAIELKPESGYITDSLGWVYYQQGDMQNALKFLLKAAELVEDDPVILEHLGDAYLASNNSEKAIAAWKKALEHQEKEDGLKERVQKKIDSLTGAPK